MAKFTNSDNAQFSRPRHLPGVELVTADYRDRGFPEHSHAEYVVGAVVAGAEMLAVRGRPYVATAGDVLLLHPDEPHANRTLGADVLSYRVLYLPADAIRSFLDPEPSRPPLSFDAPVTGEAGVFHAVTSAHAVLADVQVGPLEQESALVALLRVLTASRPGKRRSPAAAGAPPAAIALCRRYIDDCFTESFGLQALSDLTGLSVFHLVRSFKKSIGLSPLAYRNQRRVMEARVRLLAGQPTVQVALDMGYADQSHLTRQFQRIVGVSPHRYAQQ